MASLVAGLIFGGIGFIAFIYGKKTGSFRPMVIGAVLMVFPYVVSGTLLVWAIGAVLTALLFIWKE